MTSTSFYSGLNPGLWYTPSLLNQMLGTNFSPWEGLTGPIPAQQSYTDATSGALTALNGLYQRQYQVLTQADELSTTNDSSVFFRQQATSSNTGVAKSIYFDTNNQAGDVPNSTFSFNVTQVAQSTIMKSALLAPTGAAFTSGGTKTFTLTVGTGASQTNYTISFDVTLGENNQTVLGRMAAAINAAQPGVTATILNGSGGINLQLEGQTGSANTFSLTDGTGTPLTLTGPYTTSQNAQNAQFTVNGATYNQSYNNVVLLNGNLVATVTGTGSATLTVGPDTSAMATAVTNLFTAVNDLTSYLAANQYLSPGLSREWQGVLSSAAARLSDYGVSLGSNYQLKLDSSVLTSALNSNLTAVREAFGGQNSLVSDLRSFSERITGSSGATLLMAPPATGYEASYLRSLTSAPRLRLGSSLFWRTV